MSDTAWKKRPDDSLDSKNKTLRYNADGSLTLRSAAACPTRQLAARTKAGGLLLIYTARWPKPTIIDDSWSPPGVRVVP